MVAPFDLLLTHGARLRVDDGVSFEHLPFWTCLSEGCVIHGRLDTAALRLFEKGNNLFIEMVTTGETPFRVSVSLQGFTAAFARLKTAAPPEPSHPGGAKSACASIWRSGVGGGVRRFATPSRLETPRSRPRQPLPPDPSGPTLV